MAGMIYISKLRNIKELEFPVPEEGVYLLTAGNGIGKTTLLACLRRIGKPNAFPLHFPSSLESEKLDNFAGASVRYSINGEEVEYAYRGARWAPRPRKNSRVLDSFGFPSVVYIGANADRITPRPDDFVPNRPRPASPHLVTAANEIFETAKFNDLRVMNLTTGAGNQAFLLKTGNDPATYHSEKHFSLGELCVIKLVEGIRGCPNNSLILIDELEMALHPRAQIQLYNYLDRISTEKKLTVIFSTHSVSLLKTVPRKRIIYLDKDRSGRIKTIKECFPTYAIGNITLGEEKSPDAVIYVEDEAAKAVVEPLVKLTLQDQFADNILFPDIRVVPVGVFDSVVKFLNHHGSLLPARTKAFALLDQDVKVETMVTWRQRNNHQRLAEYQLVEDKLDYLPWTPEVGIIKYLRGNREDVERQLRRSLGTALLHIDQGKINQVADLEDVEMRKAAKRILKQLIEEVAAAIGRDSSEVLGAICQEFARSQFENHRKDILQLLMPKIT